MNGGRLLVRAMRIEGGAAAQRQEALRAGAAGRGCGPAPAPAFATRGRGERTGRPAVT